MEVVSLIAALAMTPWLSSPGIDHKACFARRKHLTDWILNTHTHFHSGRKGRIRSTANKTSKTEQRSCSFKKKKQHILRMAGPEKKLSM